MAPATQTQDDDLLIISDDGNTDNGDIEFSLNLDESSTAAPIETEKKEVEITASTLETTHTLDEITILDESGSSAVDNPESSSFPAETTILEEAVVTTDDTFSIDLGELPADVIEEPQDTPSEVITETSENQNEGFTFDIDSNVETLAAEIESTPAVSNENESMNDILDSTIAKLNARSEVIQGDSSHKQSQITELKAQIKALQDQVSDLEAEISAYDTEKVKIAQNIAELESMKLDPVKEHNAKRAKK